MPPPVFNYDFYSDIYSKLYNRWSNKLMIAAFDTGSWKYTLVLFLKKSRLGHWRITTRPSSKLASHTTLASHPDLHC